MMPRNQTTAHECPIGESVLVWAGACALAVERHPNASYPQPHDVKDAREVLEAAVAIRPTEKTHG